MGGEWGGGVGGEWGGGVREGVYGWIKCTP